MLEPRMNGFTIEGNPLAAMVWIAISNANSYLHRKNEAFLAAKKALDVWGGEQAMPLNDRTMSSLLNWAVMLYETGQEKRAEAPARRVNNFVKEQNNGNLRLHVAKELFRILLIEGKLNEALKVMHEAMAAPNNSKQAISEALEQAEALKRDFILEHRMDKSNVCAQIEAELRAKAKSCGSESLKKE
jgi:hypothetical protein